MDLHWSQNYPRVSATFTQSAHAWNSSEKTSGEGLDSWISPTTRIVFLGTVLPGTVLLLTLLYDLTAFIHWPKALRQLGTKIRSPFVDFLTLKDLKCEPGPLLTPPAWKPRVLVVLSVIQAAGWATVLAYGLLAGDVDNTKQVRGVVGLASWVSEQDTYLARGVVLT